MDANTKNEFGGTPLHNAAVNAETEIVALLITASADVNVKDNSGVTPLWLAAQRGFKEAKEVIELLIAKGADVNAKANGKTPLDWAMMEGGRLFVRFLREHGGKTVGELKAEADRIIGAAKDGDVEAVKQAIADRVDVNAKDSGGSTPLLHAVRADHKEVAELLIEKGADLNAKNVVGMTPLHYAAQQGHKETAELLIGKGADVNAKANDGKTPLDWAIQKSRTETADLIRKHQLMPRLVQHGRFAFSFDAEEGKVYEVQDSFNLLNWEVVKTYTGTGDSVRFDEERDHDPPKWFYRVRVVE